VAERGRDVRIGGGNSAMVVGGTDAPGVDKCNKKV